MVEAFLFFAALAVVSSLGLILTAIPSGRKTVLGILVLFALTIAYLYTKEVLILWLLILILILNILPVTSFSLLSASSMMTAISVAYWLIISGFGGLPLTFELAFAAVAAIILLAIIGIFHDSSRGFLLISAAVQILFICLEAATGTMAGGTLVFSSSIRIFNYVIAGTVFHMGMVVLTRDGALEKLGKLHGCYYARPAVSAAVGLSALSLAGIPGLNIFISEWHMLTSSYSISPAITVLAVFAAISLFVMYMKVFYLILAGERTKQVDTSRPVIAYSVLLAAASIALGLLPQLQQALLSTVIP